ncbi:MAG TPA: STAS domain-containing protein [Rubrivivax sp.]
MAQIATRQFADTLVVAPMGRIDHLSAASFEAALAPLLQQPTGGALVLDFSGVEYISSVGLRVLMIAAEKLRTQHARLLVAVLQTVVAEIFAISRFHRVLVVCPTLDAALEQASPAALAAYRQAGPGRTA